MDVGFIGLGAMGRGIAANLVAAGHRVRVWNRSRRPGEAPDGAVVVDQVAEAFAGDAVLSMLANDEAVRSVVLDSGALAAAAKAAKPPVHVNMATISVELARELTDTHRAHGVGYVAAPVFGRPDVAAAGKLHVVAAGAPAAIAAVQPLLDAVGQKTWPFGDDPYRANVVKIAGNFMLGSAIEAMAEAAALARGHGVAAADLLDMLTGTLFAAPVYKNYGALIAAGTYEPAAFALTLGLKDIKLALAASEGVHTPMPFASVLRDQLVDAIAQGDGARDFAALAKVAARRAGQTD